MRFARYITAALGGTVLALTVGCSDVAGATPSYYQANTEAIEALEQYNAEQAWYFGIEAQRRLDAAAAARTPRPSYHPGTTVGACTGFSIPDYIIARESGGNPSAYNPSGAYGCAQTLLSHYSRGSCQGLDPYSIDGQRQCVDRLSNGGTNLAPWSETR
jgi:hypothetical protein